MDRKQMLGNGKRRMFGDLKQRPALLTILAKNGHTLSFTLTALISVPLALRHLSFEEFGFWAFTSQSIGYFLLFDFGIAMAVSRLMADPLTRGDAPETNRWFTMLFLLALLQAALILTVGWLCVDPLLRWFGVSDEIFQTARSLWLWMLAMAVINFCGRVVSGILYAQNRFYWSAVGGIFAAWAGLLAFILFLSLGKGLMAYAYAAACQTALAIGFPILGVRLGNHRFRLDFTGLTLPRVREAYNFSSSLFVSQLANAGILYGPTLIVTKLMGLEGAAGFNVSTKIILTARQVLWQMFESYLPGWQRLYIEGRLHELVESWKVRFDLVLSLSFLTAIVYVAANGWFVSWWARPELYQGIGLDLAGAAFCLATTWIWGFGFAPVFAMRPWMRSLLHVCAAGITIFLGVFLTKRFGSQGVLWAATAGYALALGWYSMFSFRSILMPTPAPNHRRIWRFLPTAAIFVILAVIVTITGDLPNWAIPLIPCLATIAFMVTWRKPLQALLGRRSVDSDWYWPDEASGYPPSPF
jgi:O-antigen/teichoic acid export membrane protein